MSTTALIAEDEPLLRAELREALATLEELQAAFAQGADDADARLDGVIASLRSKLAPVDATRVEATA